MPDATVPIHTLSEALRITRKRLKWTQQRLADELLVSNNTLSRWERYRATPEPSSAERLRDFVRRLPIELSRELRVVLGDVVTVPPSGVHDVILRAAEALDVKPRALRAALDSVLIAIAGAGLSVEEARRVIASR